MRCPECCKFVSYDEPEIEVNDLEVDEDGNMTASVHVALNCAECQTELKTADIDVNHAVDVTGIEHDKKNCGMSVDEDSSEPLVDTEGGGRYMKTFYGAKIVARVYCDCGAVDIDGIEIVARVQASDMEEQV